MNPKKERHFIQLERISEGGFLKDIAIVGGGIAGLAASLFAKQKKIHIPIYEKTTHLDCKDNLLWMAPNGLHLLNKLGLLEQVQEKSVAQNKMIFSTRYLSPMMTLDCDQLIASNGYPIFAVKRRDLYQIILDELIRQGGEIFFDHVIESIDQTSDKVILSFQDRSDRVHCNYLIGADGIGSKIRNFIFPNSHVKYQGLCTYLGHSETDVASKYIGKTIEAWGFGTRFVFTSMDHKTTYWSAIERPDVYRKNSDPIADDFPQNLFENFQEYHPDILEIIKGIKPNSTHRCNFGVVSGLPKFSHDRVCLIGDAAHGMPPNMGQGASLGLEDAYCLIHLLSTQDSAAVVGPAFQKMRHKRVNQMMQLANTMNVFFQPKTGFGRWTRDCLVRMMPDRVNQKKAAQLYEFSPRF